MPTFNHISGAEPSTVTFKLATVSQTRNSSAMHQEIMALGDPDTSNAIAAVLNAVPASTAWALIVRQVGNSSIQGNSTVFQGTSPWVIGGNSTVAPLAGSTWATRPIQSSAADLQMTATQGTSPWTIAGNSTVAPLAGSTWATRPIQSSAADLQMTATPAAGSTWRTQPGSTAWASSAGFHFDSSGALNVAASFTGSTGPLTVSQLLDSSGGSVTAADSANNAIRVNVVAGAAGGSTIVTVSTGSVRVHQSTATDLNVTVGNLSTTVAISSVAGVVSIQGNSTVFQGTSPWVIGGNSTVAPLAGSTWATRPIQSSAADLQMTATIGTNLQSSVAPSSGSSGLIVRQVIDKILTTASTNTFTSTSFTIQSSGAGLNTYVTAYSILSTNAGPAKIKFYSSGTMVWPVVLAAISSAVSGVNLAVSAPAYLFCTKNAAEAMTLQLGGGGSTVAGWHVGVSYYRAP